MLAYQSSDVFDKRVPLNFHFNLFGPEDLPYLFSLYQSVSDSHRHRCLVDERLIRQSMQPCWSWLSLRQTQWVNYVWFSHFKTRECAEQMYSDIQNRKLDSVWKKVLKTHFAVVLSCCGGKMCHADLESLRLEIWLIESRVSKTRDSIIPTHILIESRVFETRDSIKQTQPYYFR